MNEVIEFVKKCVVDELVENCDKLFVSIFWFWILFFFFYVILSILMEENFILVILIIVNDYIYK